MEIRDLGPLLVEQDGLSSALGNGRLASVLGPLATRVGEIVVPADLVDAVWGQDPPARAGQLLESLIWRLRKHLEPGRAARAEATVLRRDRQGYRLDLPAAAVDSAQLRAAVPRVRELMGAGEHERVLDRSAVVLSLWRGEPYAEVVDTGWLGPARQQLADLRLELAAIRVQALLHVGRPENALAELGPLLADHPFAERLWSQRMLALYRAGRQADALATFATVRALLADELGVDPGPELHDLHRRILDHDATLIRPAVVTGSAPEVVHLPRRRTSLLGRDDDVARLVELLADTPLVTLVGPGGVGKTRLAVEVGYAARRSCPDGVWFVDLASVGEGSLLDVALVGALGLADQLLRPPLEIVTGFLAERRALLVMDNCEHVVASAAAAVQEILDRCPDVRVLATTREPLEIAGELTHPVGPLPLDSEDVPSPAIALFLERTGGTVDLDVAGHDGQLISQICAAVGGLPLGIELAAAQARTFELAEIADALVQNPGALGRRGSGPERQASLRDTVDWGYRLARGDEQILHRRLAVIPGPFTLDVAATLCEVSPLLADQALDLVGGLVHRSLLTSTRPVRAGGASMFVQLAPIRAHAAEMIDATARSAAESVRDRMLLERLAATPLDGRPGQIAVFDWLDDNAATLRATLESTLQRHPDRAAIGVVGGLVGYWFERGRLAEAAHWSELLRQLPGRIEVDRLDRALTDATVGAVLAFQHRREEAAILLRGCLTAFRSPPADRLDLVAGALVFAAAAAWTGDIWDVAAEYVDAGLALGRDADLPHLSMIARAIRAANWSFAGDPAAGISEANEVLHDNQALSNDLASLFALVALSVTALFGGRPAAALAASDELLRTHRRMGALAVGDTVETRGAIRAAAGDDDAAVRCLGASAALSRRVGREWPWHEFTPPVLAGLRDRVDPAEFDQHWSSGERLGLGDPERFTPEWL